ncbi:MAG: CHAT domain-containing protein [Okeania sp. SIO3B5]|uniref:CHAT domain-containing protein n=1 Tax=Okeania sp. SIO3B5 TaxID=2607811 RepID=UPI0014012D14|nr:CHAT domain-containing tetratricopeptide repeat protein [Okeania sp. SIO3B5]NEO52670.1 CHAT domain-containing protein [Okeania sp. SIO3B5]
MKRIIITSLIGITTLTTTPLILPLLPQRSYAQTSNSQAEKLEQLLFLARQQTRQYQSQEAVETLKQALAIARKIKNREKEADANLGLGINYRRIGNPQEALKFYNEALMIFRELVNRSGEVAALNGIGDIYRNIGQLQKALGYYQQALPITKEVGARTREIDALSGIGEIHRNIGQTQNALEYFQQALSITKEVGDRSGEADSLNSIGVVYRNIGQPQKALEYYQQALRIKREVRDISGFAAILHNIGAVYYSISQRGMALEYYQKALPIWQEVGDRSMEAITFSSIAVVYSDIGQPQKALEYYQQALPILQEVSHRLGEAMTLNNIGDLYRRIDQPQKALEYYQKALSVSQEFGYRSGEAFTLNNIGVVYHSIGKPQKALEYYHKASLIGQQVGNQALLAAATLSNIGAVYRDNNQPEKAIENLEQSVEITLKVRAGLKKENRKFFLEGNSNTAIGLVDFLIDQNKPDAAWQWYNLATTFDLADYTRLINAKVKNSEAQTQINQWQQNNQQLQFLYSKVEDEWSPQLSEQINQLQAENSQLAEKISKEYPEVAELFEFKPEDIDKLKANIAPDTVVIQPALLKGITNVPDSIVIFLVTRDKPVLVKKFPIDTKEFDSILTEYRAQLENPNADDFAANQETLYDYLIRPMEAEIAAYSPKQIAIIATDKLRYIPFETLYDNQANEYLIEKYPIHYLTRISSRIKQQENKTQSMKVLAFGNPQPTKVDLAGAEDEAKIIAKQLPNKHYIREEATLPRFKNESLGFPLVHLATHGCFQTDGCPGVGLEENTILFANGKTFNIRDAALLGLENTDLIVLSACQTAMKADSNGEEIAGVAYLFERAGADAVIASLWNAEDEMTKDIMVKFYQNLQQGMTKVEALRQAKLSYKDERPFYWSPLILIGDGE